MKLFSTLYTKMLKWASHRHASYYLAGISFSESLFFPIPPDVMLAPMALAKPEKAWWYATLTTLSSVVGALFGYLLGMFFFSFIHPFLTDLGYAAAYDQVNLWFKIWGFWILFLAGSVSPIPFKIFTIAAGTLHMSILTFVIASLIGRGARFYLVSGLMRWGGEHIDRTLRRCIDWMGWIVVIALIIAYCLYRWL